MISIIYLKPLPRKSVVEKQGLPYAKALEGETFIAPYIS